MNDVEAPTTYADWLPLIDRFRDGDNSALEQMRRGTIEWTAVVAERFTAQVSSALTARLQALTKQLQRGFEQSQGDTFAISRALISARRSLVPLRDFAAIPGLPANVADYLRGEIARWVQQGQESLEKSAASIRTDGGRLLKVIRDTPLTTIEAQPSAPVEPDVSSQAAPRRRIIL